MMNPAEFDRSHYYRDVELDGDPIVEAIEELQEDVVRIDEKNDEQDERIEALENKTYDHWVDSTQTRRYIDCLNGDDANDGLTENTPLRSVDKALEALNKEYNSLFVILTTPGTYPFNYVKYLFSGVTLHVYGEKETGFTPAPEAYVLQPVARQDTGTKTLTFYNSRLHFENCTFDNTIQGGNITIEGCSIYTSYVNWKCGGTNPYLVLNSSDYQGETLTKTNCYVQLNNGAQAKFNGLTQNIEVAHSTDRALGVLYNSLCIVRTTHTVSGDYDDLYYVYNGRLALQALTITAPTKNITPIFSTIFAGEAIRTELGYNTASELTLWVDKPRLISDLALRETT